MAYSKQTWDTTSYVNPTRMNHIEDGIEAADSKTADDIPYSTGVSVKDKIDDAEKVEIIPFTPSASASANSIVYKVGNNLLIISIDVTFSSGGGGWTEAFTISMQGKKCDGVFGATYNGVLVQAFGNDGIVVRLMAPTANVTYRGLVIVPLQDV